MTDKEAIEYIKSIRGLLYTEIKEVYEALDKAMEALEKLSRIDNIIEKDLGDKYAYDEILKVLEVSKKDEVIEFEFNSDIDKPNKYKTSDGKWHEGKTPHKPLEDYGILELYLGMSESMQKAVKDVMIVTQEKK